MSDATRWFLLGLILIALTALLTAQWTDVIGAQSQPWYAFTRARGLRTSAGAGATAFGIAWAVAWQIRVWTDTPRWLSTAILAAVCAVAAGITWFVTDLSPRGAPLHLLLWVTCFMAGVTVDVLAARSPK